LSKVYAEDEDTLISRHKNPEVYHSLMTANKSLEYMGNFRYLDVTVSNQNSIHEEIQCRL